MLHFTTPALNWLCTIFKERFGHSFAIDQIASGLKLSLASESKGYILFPKLEEAFHQSHSDFPCCQWDAKQEGWASALDQPLPAPCVSELPEPLITHQVDYTVIHYDILGLTYWMLNRIEEVGRTDLDIHGRFPAIHSHSYKHGYLDRPIVDEWLHILGQVIQKQWPLIKLKKHQFSIKVSHDVDLPSRYGFASAKRTFRNMVGDLVKRRDLKSVIAAPLVRASSKKKLSIKDPYNTFDRIMDLSEKHEIKSAFYFICGRTHPTKDADYEIEHPAIRDLICNIHSRGHEIGLHPSYNTYEAPNTLKKEADRLRTVMQNENIRQTEIGGRMHYLRWEQPTTLQAWDDADMSYDSTMGYADIAGFRCGTCFDYPAFNSISQKVLKVRVRPLIVMEGTIISNQYMGLGYSEFAYKKINQLKCRCRLMNGCFTLLWHNSHFLNESDWLLYERVISDC